MMLPPIPMKKDPPPKKKEPKKKLLPKIPEKKPLPPLKKKPIVVSPIHSYLKKKKQGNNIQYNVIQQRRFAFSDEYLGRSASYDHSDNVIRYEKTQYIESLKYKMR